MTWRGLRSAVYEGVNREPSARDLQLFGWSAGALLLGMGLWLGRTGHGGPLTAGPLLGGVVLLALATLGGAAAAALRPVFGAWVLVSAPVGFLVQRLALCLFYYVVLTPVAVALRVAGRDLLGRRFVRQATTYWDESRPPQDAPARYHRPY